MSEKSRRLHILKNACKKAGADYALITNMNKNPNFFWLTNCDYGDALLWDFKTKPRIITNAIEAPLCKKAWVKSETGKTDEILKTIAGGAGFDATDMNVAFQQRMRNLRVKPGTDISKSLETTRAVKSGYEIRRIKKACKITKRIFDIAIRLSFGQSERGIFALIRKKTAELGVQEAFDAIVCRGHNIASPHHLPTASREKGALLVDVGLRYDGYCSDVTRTYGSRYTKIGEKIHEILQGMICDGASCKELDETARKILGDYSRFFITSLGHGIGVAVHEMPQISSKSDDVLRKGNVITIEPGIYMKNGMRVENMYLVKKNGCENLTDW